MNEQTQDLKAVLLQTNEEFHTLAAQHHTLEDRLHELVEKPHLSEPEQLEEITLKIQAQNQSINDLLSEGAELAQRLQEKIAVASKGVAGAQKKR